MKTLLIANPHSGTGGSKEQLAQWAGEVLIPAGHEVHTVFTEYAGHATVLAQQAVDEDYDTVVACGGDGTVNETARALCATDTTLGIVPCGSGNGLARHMQIPLDPRAALEVIASGDTETCDYCTAGGIPFFCTFGMGFDAAVSDRFASTPHRRGLKNYLRSVVEELSHYHSNTYTLTTDAGVITDKAFIIACCNASQYGNNAFIAPGASITDGLVDITVIHHGTLLEHALSGMELLSGAIHKSPRIDTLQTRSVRIHRSEPGAVHLDGEPHNMGTDIDVVCHHAALKIFSHGQLKVLPLLTPLGITLPWPT